MCVCVCVEVCIVFVMAYYNRLEFYAPWKGVFHWRHRRRHQSQETCGPPRSAPPYTINKKIVQNTDLVRSFFFHTSHFLHAKLSWFGSLTDSLLGKRVELAQKRFGVEALQGRV